ncbi:MAG TPA: ribonuclease HII [Alphaproteobacteria bacterium]
MPSCTYEKRFSVPVAGIDEAGRGPLAGPVVAACVHIPNHTFPGIRKVKDSKQLNGLQREALFTEITRHCAFGIAVADVEEIDTINILEASFLAMHRAVDAMHLAFNVGINTFLIDGNMKPRGMEAHDCHPIIKGDDKSYSIACASILAKVTRDRIMRQLHEDFPHYGWNTNVGYSTPDHWEALNKHGPCQHHRQSFDPVRAIIPPPLKRATYKDGLFD